MTVDPKNSPEVCKSYDVLWKPKRLVRRQPLAIIINRVRLQRSLGRKLQVPRIKPDIVQVNLGLGRVEEKQIKLLICM